MPRDSDKIGPPSVPAPRALIDVVIPVHRGESETRACVESVLAARNRLDHEVVVIDDASPEPALSEWLRSLAGSGRITLIAHEANRGFVATANEGMALHGDRDVVLLNSDTEVPEGWLDRLAAHAARDKSIGTVTPFSTNATILSYPRTLEPNELPRGETTASLDAAFSRANAGRSIDIPTAVGFCMLITRECIGRIGTFDEARYGAGYGEEVDFCLRAARAGFRNVAAGDVFVRHVGGVSFGDSGAARRERAQAVVDGLYPEFQPRLREFLAADPARELRRGADLERLRASPRPRLLFVSHAFGGGVRRHIDELVDALAQDREILLLQPFLKSFMSLTWIGGGEEFQLWFHAEEGWEDLVGVLAAVGIDRVHFHHIHGLPPSVLTLPQRLGASHDVTVHDYFALCPRYHMNDAAGHYCGEKGDPQCLRCLDAGPVQWSLSIDQWRSAFRRLLAGAQRVIAPSHDAAERVRRYYPEVAPVVWPHAQARNAAMPGVAKILVPGGLSPAKGIGLLEACARDALSRGLPLHFRVVGYLARVLPRWPELPLSVTGEYRDDTLRELMALERAQGIFFPNQVPETFSYTLSAALDSGLPIVATNLGAMPERLAGIARARIIPWDETPARVNDALMQSVGAMPSTAGAWQPEMSFARYRELYLQPPAAGGSGARGPMPEAAALCLRPPHEDLPVATLVNLYEDGVGCGKTTSLAALGHLVAQVEMERVAMRALQALTIAERDAALTQAQSLQSRLHETGAAREQLERRLEEHRESTSWKLTAPLRALVHWLRRPS
jgi:GT2 family glycosyltransferase/glycosyltransferase involved in cell wall biosynthesis